MIHTSPIIQTLNSLLTTINTLYLCHSKHLVLTYNSKLFSELLQLCSNYYLRVFYNKKSTLIHTTLTIDITRNIIHTTYTTTIQSISILLLLHINPFFNSSQAVQSYLERYKNTFRGFFIRNCIGSSFYDNDIYINSIATLNLYVLLLCSKRKGAYILWIYLIFYKIQKPSLM